MRSPLTKRREKIPLELRAKTPYEIAGAALELLLVLRTNAGYDAGWEARRLWGGIINNCRHLVLAALCYGPDNVAWRDRLISLTASFAHVARRSLRSSC